MIDIISAANAARHRDLLVEVHRFRYRLFVEHLGWPLSAIDGMEYDAYDNDDALYVVHRGPAGEVNACFRAIPMCCRTMLAEVFPHLVTDIAMPRSADVLEYTRYGVDPVLLETDRRAFRRIDEIMRAAMYELPLALGARSMVFVTEMRWPELAITKYGIEGRPLGKAHLIGGLPTGAWEMPARADILERLRRHTNLTGPVIHNLSEVMVPLAA